MVFLVMRENILEALEFLRNEAVAAHLAGDGVRVASLAMLALRDARTSNESGVSYSSYRWAVFLGLHWMVNDDLFLHALYNNSQFSREDALSECDGLLGDYLYSNLDQPPFFGDEVQPPELTADWYEQRSECTEDVAAVCLAYEIAWLSSPTASAWRSKLIAAIDAAKRESLLQRSLRTLQSRLNIQADLCFERAEKLTSDFNGTAASPFQSQIAKGWFLFFLDRMSELDDLLRKLSHEMSITRPEYPAFFNLAHFSRLSRSSPEDQFTALARHADASRNQVTYEVRQLRTLRYLHQYKRLAERGFSSNQSSERWSCLRMSMIAQLAALREWDVGEWIIAKSHEASSLLELGAAGDLESANRGLVATVRSLGSIELDKNPHLGVAVQLLDAMSIEVRVDFISQLLNTSRRGAGAAYGLFKVLSDSIPEQQLREVAKWSANLEDNRPSYTFRISFLDWWYEVIYFATNAAEIVDELASSLLRTMQNPAAWDVLSQTLCWSIIRGNAETAERLLDALLGDEIEATNAHFDRKRFYTVLTIANESESLRPKAAKWLAEFVDATTNHPQSPLYAYYVRRIGFDSEGRSDDSQLREWISERLQLACTSRLEEKGPSFSVFAETYHGLIRLTQWPSVSDTLIDSLISVIESPYIPYVNKVDPIACLGSFAEIADAPLVERISLQFERWIKNGVKGRDLGFTSGPLSSGQMHGMDASAAVSGLWYLAGALAKTASIEYVNGRFHDWFILEAPRVGPEQLSDVIQVALILARRLQPINPGKAMGLVAICESAIGRAGESQLPTVIDGFRATTFGDGRFISRDQADEWLPSESAQFCLMLWTKRLQEMSQRSNASIRRATAAAIVAWEKSSAGLPGSLVKVKHNLQRDCRMRVRHQIATSTTESES